MFYNTANETGVALEAAKKTNADQKKVIFEIFNNTEKQDGFTSYEIFRACGSKFIQNSVRRALSNLKDEGKIYDSGDRRNGFYGRKQIVWKLNK